MSNIFILCSEDTHKDIKIVHSYTRDIEVAKQWCKEMYEANPDYLYHFEAIDEYPQTK